MNKEELYYVQNSIGYQFKNLKLLNQAFTRKSYAQEHPEAEHNEILEFYGDAVLNFFITKLMFNQFSRIEDELLVSEKNEGELSKLKAVYISKETLARCVFNLGFSDFLYLGKSDIKNEVKNSLSVNEDLFEAILGAVATDCFWDFPTLEKVCRTMLQMETSNTYVSILVQQKSQALGFGSPIYKPIRYQIENTEDIQSFNFFEERLSISSLRYGRNPETNFFEYGIQLGKYKFLGTSTNAPYQAKLDADKQALLFLCNYEINQKMPKLDFSNPVSQLHELHQKEIILSEPNYIFTEYHDSNGNPIWRCTVSLEGLSESFVEENVSKKIAKQQAALKLLKILAEFQTTEVTEWPEPVFYHGMMRDPEFRAKWGVK